jgi:hypothetical protein
MRRVRKLIKLIKCAIFNSQYFLLNIIKEEALEHLKTFDKIGIGATEEIQDLIYHIDSYIEIPKILQNTIYKGYLEKGEMIEEYFHDLETHRAVEREYIFNLLKKLPIGFQL